MKVLTLREPFASLIGEKKKIIETRSWTTSYRGELYIHAGIKKINLKDERTQFLMGKLEGNLHYGNIFAKCKISDCKLIDKEFALSVKKNDYLNFYAGNYDVGRYAWILSDIVIIEDIRAKGKLGIWNYFPENTFDV